MSRLSNAELGRLPVSGRMGNRRYSHSIDRNTCKSGNDERRRKRDGSFIYFYARTLSAHKEDSVKLQEPLGSE